LKFLFNQLKSKWLYFYYIYISCSDSISYLHLMQWQYILFTSHAVTVQKTCQSENKNHVLILDIHCIYIHHTCTSYISCDMKWRDNCLTTNIKLLTTLSTMTVYLIYISCSDSISYLHLMQWQYILFTSHAVTVYLIYISCSDSISYLHLMQWQFILFTSHAVTVL
jgi:hypothetical protein